MTVQVKVRSNDASKGFPVLETSHAGNAVIRNCLPSSPWARTATSGSRQLYYGSTRDREVWMKPEVQPLVPAVAPSPVVSLLPQRARVCCCNFLWAHRRSEPGKGCTRYTSATRPSGLGYTTYTNAMTLTYTTMEEAPSLRLRTAGTYY